MLAFNNLTLGYNRHPVVHHLSAAIPAGSYVALVGSNGAGKSTLLKAILRQLTPLGGSIEIKAQSVAYMPQQSQLERDFPLLVHQVASAGLWAQSGAFAHIGKQHRAQVQAALAQLHIAHLANTPVGALSGGQFQRLLFARLLLQDAELLLLDEPFNAVDSATIDDMLILLKNLNQQGKTIIMVAHDLHLVQNHIPTSLLLAGELIAFGDTQQVLSADNLARAQQNMLAHQHLSHQECRL